MGNIGQDTDGGAAGARYGLRARTSARLTGTAHRKYQTDRQTEAFAPLVTYDTGLYYDLEVVTSQ
jgi:hypothetical protein